MRSFITGITKKTEILQLRTEMGYNIGSIKS